MRILRCRSSKWITVLFICSITILGLAAGSQAHQTNTLSSSNGPSTTHAVQSAATSTSPFDYIVTVLTENNGYCDVMTTCGGSGTYMTSLAQSYSVVGQNGYTAVDHPSQPNYIALAGASTLGISGDGNCCGQLSDPNILDRIESSGRTWQAWAEDASGSGTCSFSPPRSADHFPFLEFSDITNNSTRCTHFQSTTSSSDTEFLASLSSTSPANYIWLTPNDNDNCHDTSIPTCDSYIAGLVPKILGSNLFKTQKAALFIVYDEGNGSYPSDWVYAAWAGPVVKTGYVGTGSYSHYSYAKTLETVWGMPSLTSNDAAASAMTEFFGASTPLSLSTSFTISGAPVITLPVTFASSTTGGKTPYSVTWNFGDGSVGSGVTAFHVFTAAQTFTVTETVTDSSTPTQTATSSQQVTVSTPAQLSASFTANPINPQTGTPVTFTATAAGGIRPYSYAWNFADGQTGTGQTTTHTYATAGSYTAVLNATDALNHGVTASNTITVSSTPAPDFTITAAPSSLTVQQGDYTTTTVTVSSMNSFSGTVSFTASADTGLNISLAQSSATISPGASQSLTVTIGVLPDISTGSYNAIITGTTMSLLRSTSLAVRVTLNHQPRLTVPGPMSVNPGSTIQFTVNATDPDPSLTLLLAVNNLPQGASFNPSTGLFTWTPSSSQSGTYTVTFTATDNGSPSMTTSQTATITINHSTPPPQQPATATCPLLCQVASIGTLSWVLIGVLGGITTVVALVYVSTRTRLANARRMKRQKQD